MAYLKPTPAQRPRAPRADTTRPRRERVREARRGARLPPETQASMSSFCATERRRRKGQPATAPRTPAPRPEKNGPRQRAEGLRERRGDAADGRPDGRRPAARSSPRRAPPGPPPPSAPLLQRGAGVGRRRGLERAEPQRELPSRGAQSAISGNVAARRGPRRRRAAAGAGVEQLVRHGKPSELEHGERALRTSGARPRENLAAAARRLSFAASALAADDMRAARRKSSGTWPSRDGDATSKGGRTSMALGGGLAFDCFCADACARQARSSGAWLQCSTADCAAEQPLAALAVRSLAFGGCSFNKVVTRPICTTRERTPVERAYLVY